MMLFASSTIPSLVTTLHMLLSGQIAKFSTLSALLLLLIFSIKLAPRIQQQYRYHKLNTVLPWNFFHWINCMVTFKLRLTQSLGGWTNCWHGPCQIQDEWPVESRSPSETSRPQSFLSAFLSALWTSELSSESPIKVCLQHPRCF